MSGDTNDRDGLWLLAWAHIVIGGAGLVLGFMACAWLAGQPEGGGDLLIFTGLFFAIVAMAWLLPMLLGGAGLLLNRPWAPTLLAVTSVTLLPLVPVGTALGLYGLFMLAVRRAAMKGPISAIWRGLLLANWVRLWLCAFAALAILGVLLLLGYLFRDQLEHAPRMTVMARFGIILAIAAVVVVVGWLGGAAGGTNRFDVPAMMRRAKAREETKVVVAEHNARVAGLLADPARAKYGRAIGTGDYWTDEQIAYDMDRSAVVTCGHLQIVEKAMRLQPMVMKPLQGMHLQAKCRVDWQLLSRKLGQQTQIAFEPDVFYPDRTPTDFAETIIKCTTCNSGIHCIHERDVKPDTATFPRQ